MFGVRPAMTSGPVVGQPVMPVPAGSVQEAAGPKEMNVPTLQLAEANAGQEAVYVAGQPKAVAAPGLTFTKDPTPAAALGERAGVCDRRGIRWGRLRISFYHSSKGEAVGRDRGGESGRC